MKIDFAKNRTKPRAPQHTSPLNRPALGARFPCESTDLVH
jgi:hypothetical protein